ncbi:transmembrane protein 198-like [Argopecten irradians]|uniref:transmembrane protein 198-like n=1 Tax=Argopecten irradians TaxID=31199 RepID=UPI00371259E3
MASGVFIKGRQLLQSTEIEYGNQPPNTTVVVPEGSTLSSHQSCDQIDYHYDIAIGVICSMCFVFGIIYTFFGYRFFKAIMFLTGFIFSAVLVYVILSEHEILPLLGNIGVAVGAGILCGIITMLVQYVGLFLTGFQLGVSVSIAALIILEFFYHPETIWIPIGVLSAVGLLFAILTLKFQRTFTILGTSVFGGALMVACLDYFIEKFMILIYSWERVKGVNSDPICWYSWVILGCWPFCFLVGSITQWKITGQGYDHREAGQNRRMKKVNLQRVRQRQKHETQHSRYRHLYQTRRLTGDVITQGYLTSEHQKLSPSTKHQTIIPTEHTPELESTNTTLTQIP